MRLRDVPSAWAGRQTCMPGMVSIMVRGIAVLGAVCTAQACSGPAEAPVPHAQASAIGLGAAVMAPNYRAFVPSLAEALHDNPEVYELGCHGDFDDVEPKPCRFGPEKAAVTVALVGDSHAAQWEPALKVLASDQNFRLLTFTKSSCPFSLAANLKKDARHSRYTACDQWNRNVLAKLLSLKPRLVIASQSRFSPVAKAKGAKRLDAMAGGLEKAWRPLLDEQIGILAIRDTPRPAGNVLQCLATYGPQARRCHTPRSDGVPDPLSDPQALAAREMPGVRVADMADTICDPFDCAPIVGGVVVWRDNNHLTATYARSLAPMLGEEVKAALASKPR